MNFREWLKQQDFEKNDDPCQLCGINPPAKDAKFCKACLKLVTQNIQTQGLQTPEY